MPTFDFGLGSENNSGNATDPVNEPSTSLDDVTPNNNTGEPSVTVTDNNNNTDTAKKGDALGDDKPDNSNDNGSSDDSSLKEGSVVTIGIDSITIFTNGYYRTFFER